MAVDVAAAKRFIDMDPDRVLSIGWYVGKDGKTYLGHTTNEGATYHIQYESVERLTQALETTVAILKVASAAGFERGKDYGTWIEMEDMTRGR